MRALEDLHPDDAATRIGLRELLIAARNEQGLGQRGLARRLGQSQSAVGYTEAGTSWRLVTVQRWARALDRHLILRPEGVPTWDDDQQDVIAAFRPADPDRADMWDQARLVNALVYARQELGVSQAKLAARLGSTEAAVSHIDRGESGLMFMTPQRYCRALGGSLWVGVEELIPERTTS